MNAKTTMVTLAVGDVTREFEIGHAERLLRITKAGWHIPAESKFEFVNNGIRVKPNTQNHNERKKRQRDNRREVTPTKG